MITLTVIGVLLIALGVGGNAARAEDGCNSCHRKAGCLFSRNNNWTPNVTYYAPYPWWWPQYFVGAPHSDYQVSQYITPPAETAAAVKERLRVINASNPALLPAASERLPAPKQDTLPPPR